MKSQIHKCIQDVDILMRKCLQAALNLISFLCRACPFLAFHFATQGDEDVTAASTYTVQHGSFAIVCPNF